MATESRHSPIIFIVGPTASGKTGLAIELAQRVGGEIIAADSRTVYKDMDLGTAKPSAEEQAAVPHWGLDLVAPGEPFNVSDFKSYAVQKIAEIRARGNIPFIVGGTGLYVDALLFDYQFGAPADLVLREQLQAMTVEQLQAYCEKNNVPLPENVQNKRHLIRQIELGKQNNNRQTTPVEGAIVVGIATDKEILEQRIAARFEQLLTNGVVEEATMLGKKYGWESEAMTGNIYPLLRRYGNGELTIEQVRELFIIADRQLAKRQLTWLKRNEFIHWLPLAEAGAFVLQSLKK